MTGYVISAESRRDLAAIDDYTASRWGNEQARAYIAGIWQSFDKLAAKPELGRRRPDVPPPYLVFPVGSHIIIYRLNAEADRIEVLNVLHPAMDIGPRITEALQRRK